MIYLVILCCYLVPVSLAMVLGAGYEYGLMMGMLISFLVPFKFVIWLEGVEKGFKMLFVNPKKNRLVNYRKRYDYEPF